MDIKSLIEKRAKLMLDAQTLILQDNVTAEIRSQFDAMLAEADTIEADITRMKAVEKFETEHRARTTPPRSNPGANSNGIELDAEQRSAQEKRAFEQFFLRGLSGVSAELRPYLVESRDLTTGNTAQVIPQGFLPTLIDAQRFYGPISAIVGQRVTDNNGAPVKVAFANDTANSVTVLGEATAVSEEDAAFSGTLMYTDTLTSGLVKISWQELADSAFDLASYMKTKFGMRFGRGLENMITNGNGSNINSLIAGYASNAVNTVSPTAIAYGDLAAAYAALDPAFLANAKFIMNSKTRGALIATTDGYGRPLFDMSPNSDVFNKLFGCDVVLNQSLPNIPSVAGNKTPVMFGDFNAGYLLRTDGAPTMVTLTERYADTLENGYFSYQRVGGIVTNAGVAPVVSLVMAG